MTEQLILTKFSEAETKGIRFGILSADTETNPAQVSQARLEIVVRMPATRNIMHIIHASLTKNYVLELVIGKGALKDTFL